MSEDPIDALLRQVSLNGDKPESFTPKAGNFKDLRVKLIEYWTEEVAHMRAQSVRLMEMGHEEGAKILDERCEYAFRQLKNVKHGGQ